MQMHKITEPGQLSPGPAEWQYCANAYVAVDDGPMKLAPRFGRRRLEGSRRIEMEGREGAGDLGRRRKNSAHSDPAGFAIGRGDPGPAVAGLDDLYALAGVEAVDAIAVR